MRDAILLQLEDIKNGNITDAELWAAKKSLLNSYRQLYDNPFDLQGFYGGRSLFGISDTVEDCLKMISGVTVKQITELAKQISLDSVFFVEGTADSCNAEGEDDE